MDMYRSMYFFLQMTQICQGHIKHKKSQIGTQQGTKVGKYYKKEYYKAYSFHLCSTEKDEEELH